MPKRTFRDIRIGVLERDKWICQVCGGPATEIDHRWPGSLGGSDHPTNLRAICAPCNHRKKDRVTTAGGRRAAKTLCSHCKIGNKGDRHGSLCNACAQYRSRNGRLPPPELIAKRLDKFVAARDQRSPDWIVGSRMGGLSGKERPS